MKQIVLIFLVSMIFYQCSPIEKKEATHRYQTVGSIERLNSSINSIIPAEAQLEILASGFIWSEGPLWLESENALIFSDVPANTIYKWSETDSISTYLKPSGYNGSEENKHEPGSNGLILDNDGKLILCQHGERQVARMEAPLNSPDPNYQSIIHDYNGLRLNSPNDIVMSKSGIFYFTDPPYGLDEWNIKELDFQGVYKLGQDGSVTLLIDSLTRPNGIGLSPDEKTLYIAVSDPQKATYYAYDLDSEGLIQQGRMILDVTDVISDTRKGLPDGMAVSKTGYLFASGPGGILIIDPKGNLSGTILTGEATANCTFNDDESVLYITADMHLMRLRLKG